MNYYIKMQTEIISREIGVVWILERFLLLFSSRYKNWLTYNIDLYIEQSKQIRRSNYNKISFVLSLVTGKCGQNEYNFINIFHRQKGVKNYTICQWA